MYSKQRFIIRLASMSVLLTTVGCSAGNSTSQPQLFPNVSKATFVSALKRETVSVDEFRGSVEIAPHDSKDFGIRSNHHTMALIIDITRLKNDKPFVVKIFTGFEGPEHISHNSLDIKSSSGVFSLDGLSQGRRDSYSGGDFVTEQGAANLSKSQFSQFCKVLKGDSVIARLSGDSGSPSSLTLKVTPRVQTMLQNSCTIFAGLSQGYVIPGS
jgi:hypothetical protein